MNPAFNGDSFAQENVARLIKKHNIQTAIETGTYHGDTTLFLASLVPRVITIESSYDNYEAASDNLIETQNVRVLYGMSAKWLSGILLFKFKSGIIFFYLDAHNPDCPLLDELKVISKYCQDRAVIAIHDFVIPGKDFGYDSYNGHALDYDYIKDILPEIYPSGFTYSYNDQAEGARRGIIYIEPK